MHCYHRLLLTALAVISSAECAKILGVFQWPAPSHHIITSRLMTELAARGHEVTVITALPYKTQLKNLRVIELTGTVEHFQGMRKKENMFLMADRSPFATAFFVGMFGSEMSDHTLSHESVQKILKSNETFDLILKEQFQDDSLQGLAYHFKAPVVIISTLGSSAYTNRLVGNPASPSYVVDVFLSYSSQMTFVQRTWNTIAMIFHDLTNVYFSRLHNNILHKHFPDAPHIDELIYNTSLVLLNTHSSFASAVPLVPNMVQIGGFHVEPPKKLPDDLQRFLDDAKEGVVYFSLGSNLKSKELPEQKRDAILKVFSGLKMKVLWKWEDDRLPGQPENVKILKWTPQQDVLAHPNVKLFITHGGLLSTIEAIYHGVPIVGIPIFGDQMLNMVNAERNGYGLTVPYQELSQASLGAALNEVIQNPKYRENAKQRSQLLRDQQVKPIDNAIYWVEYVIKHNGAKHLQSAALHLCWYQYLLLDVVGFLVLIVFTLIAVTYVGCKKMFGTKKTRSKTD